MTRSGGVGARGRNPGGGLSRGAAEVARSVGGMYRQREGIVKGEGAGVAACGASEGADVAARGAGEVGGVLGLRSAGGM